MAARSLKSLRGGRTAARICVAGHYYAPEAVPVSATALANIRAAAHEAARTGRPLRGWGHPTR